MLDIICEISIALFAVACDLKNRKIPNILCLYGVCSGFLMTLIGVGKLTPVQSLIGIMLPVVSLWVLYASRILGAGDIKLFSAIGAFAGIDIWKIICLSMLVGALAGAAALVRRLVRYFRCSGREGVLAGGLTRICFSVPIALGLALYALINSVA